MRTKWKTLLGSLAMSLGAVVAQANAPERSPVTVEVLDSLDAPFAQFPLAGSAADVYRAYLRAQRGATYRIRVHNRTAQRVGLVIAVDGRNIVTGARSELQRREGMYVLEPWSDGDFAGWRTDLSSVNEFYFTEWSNSYAEAFADRSARGVIAVAAYPERVEYRPEAAQRRAEGDRAVAPSAERGAGTGYGERRRDPVRRVEFEPQGAALAQVFLKYEWPETLCRRGLGCNSRRENPNRFWDEDDNGFAPPPPPPRFRRGEARLH